MDHHSVSTEPIEFPLTARQTRLRADTIRENGYIRGHQCRAPTTPPSSPLPTPDGGLDDADCDNFSEFSDDCDFDFDSPSFASRSPSSSRSASSSEGSPSSSASSSVGSSRSPKPPPPPKPTPRLQLLLRAMDRVSSGMFEANLTTFYNRGLRVPFWVVLGKNTSQALGHARAELISKITCQRVTVAMVRRVEIRWARVWQIAQGLEERKRFAEAERDKETHGMMRGLGLEALKIEVKDLKEEPIC